MLKRPLDERIRRWWYLRRLPRKERNWLLAREACTSALRDIYRRKYRSLDEAYRRWSWPYGDLVWFLAALGGTELLQRTAKGLPYVGVLRALVPPDEVKQLIREKIHA